MSDTNKIEPVLMCDCKGNCQDDDSATCPCMNTPCPDEGCVDPEGNSIYICSTICACNVKGECGVDVITEDGEKSDESSHTSVENSNLNRHIQQHSPECFRAVTDMRCACGGEVTDVYTKTGIYTPRFIESQSHKHPVVPMCEEHSAGVGYAIADVDNFPGIIIEGARTGLSMPDSALKPRMGFVATVATMKAGLPWGAYIAAATWDDIAKIYSAVYTSSEQEEASMLYAARYGTKLSATVAAGFFPNLPIANYRK